MRILLNTLTKASKVFEHIETYLMVFSMAIFAFTVVVDVICRKFFGFSLSFLQELGKYLMVWATFIGASLGVKYSEHPSMTLAIDSINGLPKIILSVLMNIVSSAACGYAAYWSICQFQLLRKMGTMTTSLGKIPVYALYIVVPIGFITMAIRFLIQTVKQSVILTTSEEGKQS